MHCLPVKFSIIYLVAFFRASDNKLLAMSASFMVIFDLGSNTR